MWDERYAQEEYAYGTEPNDFLKAQYAYIPKGGRVLCIAEGEGRNAVFLARQGYQVTAVDQSRVGLQKAEKLAAKHGVSITTEVADLTHYDLGKEQWDGIVSISAHMPLALRQQLHTKVVLALKSQGVFILEAYTERHAEMAGIGGPPPSQKEFFMSLNLLTEELAGLHFVIGAEVDRHVSEGKYHYGESAVVQVVGRKNKD